MINLCVKFLVSAAVIQRHLTACVVYGNNCKYN